MPGTLTPDGLPVTPSLDAATPLLVRVGKSVVRRCLARLPSRLRDFVAAELSADLRAQHATLSGEVQALRNELRTLQGVAGDAPQFVPPGHFYSPIPSLAEVHENKARIFERNLRTLPGIDSREAQQLDLLEEFRGYYAEQPFSATKRPDRRYFFENPSYGYSDAIFLYCMLRHTRPKRLIEVGSGYSTAASFDTIELFLGNAVRCTLIEPYPQLVRTLFKPGDEQRTEILATRLQDVPLSRFEALDGGDVLFIDSTHVSRIGSDVNYIVFDILPALKPGVLVHFHDVFWPFEYPEEWIEEGRQWQEDYLLRAFLEYNTTFDIVACNTFLETFHMEWFERHMPLCTKNLGGSLWLRKRPTNER
jgi:predicted O-methyltransferase YrrM